MGVSTACRHEHNIFVRKILCFIKPQKATPCETMIMMLLFAPYEGCSIKRLREDRCLVLIEWKGNPPRHYGVYYVEYLHTQGCLFMTHWANLWVNVWVYLIIDDGTVSNYYTSKYQFATGVYILWICKLHNIMNVCTIIVCCYHVTLCKKDKPASKQIKDSGASLLILSNFELHSRFTV